MKHLTLGFAFLSIIATSCKKESTNVQFAPENTIEYETLPLTGLVIATTTFTMGQMTANPDLEINHNNNYLAILAKAFQEIACDSSFNSSFIGLLNVDLECSVEHYLDHNPNYKNIVNIWLNTHGHNDYDNLLIGHENKPWIYAANYGVHSNGSPILALSVELGSTILGEKDDFIPCYYSDDNCNGYKTGLVGLESDLGPEDPALPTSELTLIFSAEAEESYNKKERKYVGDLSTLSGTVVNPGTPNCEYSEAYKITQISISQKFNKSKKVKVASRFRDNKDCDNDWGGSDSNWGRDKIIVGKNLLNTNHSTSYNLESCQSANCQVNDNDVFGVVFEKDWYSSKWLSGSYTSVNCPNPRYIELKIKSKKNTEIYAYYAFFAYWCFNEVREFNVPANMDGDHNSTIRIKATNY